MSAPNRVCQTLHDEHVATVALMERLEQVIARYRKGSLPDANDQAVALLLTDLSIGLEKELERHFAFEEEELFTFLTAMGDEAIGAHLADEHTAIRPVGGALVKLARESRAQGFDAARWNEFCRLGQDLSERLLAHVQKEEMALLPVLDESMDADTEAQLYEKYVEAG
jgi:hemerythrin-like domain-containing protein